MLLTWPGQADKNFQGRTKIFSTIAEIFIPGQKFLGGQFFLDSPHTVFPYSNMGRVNNLYS